jgi:hypothetical protein
MPFTQSNIILGIGQSFIMQAILFANEDKVISELKSKGYDVVKTKNDNNFYQIDIKCADIKDAYQARQLIYKYM